MGRWYYLGKIGYSMLCCRDSMMFWKSVATVALNVNRVSAPNISLVCQFVRYSKSCNINLWVNFMRLEGIAGHLALSLHWFLFHISVSMFSRKRLKHNHFSQKPFLNCLETLVQKSNFSSHSCQIHSLPLHKL